MLMTKKLRIPSLLLVALPWLWGACTYKSDQAMVDITGEESYQLYDYYVDEYGNEGIVAYTPDKYSFLNYMIVISADETLLPWGLMGEKVCPTDSLLPSMIVNPSFSLSMIQVMKAQGISKYPAMAWCDAKNGGEEQASGSSWRLPSRRELALICGSIKERSWSAGYEESMKYLNQALRSIGGTEIDPQHTYWTCQEDFAGLYPQEEGANENCDPNNRVLPMQPDNTLPTNKNLWIKKCNHYVRAIKYIFYARN